MLISYSITLDRSTNSGAVLNLRSAPASPMAPLQSHTGSDSATSQTTPSKLGGLRSPNHHNTNTSAKNDSKYVWIYFEYTKALNCDTGSPFYNNMIVELSHCCNDLIGFMIIIRIKIVYINYGLMSNFGQLSLRWIVRK